MRFPVPLPESEPHRHRSSGRDHGQYAETRTTLGPGGDLVSGRGIYPWPRLAGGFISRRS
eukprot:2039885-Pyramimonas_sp.AAC.1